MRYGMVLAPPQIHFQFRIQASKVQYRGSFILFAMLDPRSFVASFGLERVKSYSRLNISNRPKKKKRKSSRTTTSSLISSFSFIALLTCSSSEAFFAQSSQRIAIEIKKQNRRTKISFETDHEKMSKSLSYGSVGNAFHYINLANIAVYGSCIYMFGSNKAGLFDSNWLEEGFCLQDTETTFWTTHDVSCYVMLAMSLLGLVVLYAGHNKPGMDRANQLTFWAIIGAIGHGLTHELIANGKRMGFYPEEADSSFIDDVKGDPWWLILAKIGPGFPLFWVPLVKTYMMNTTKNRVVVTAFVFQIGALFTPVKFGFSYAQMVLFAGLSFDQLFLLDNEKGFEYALWPILTIVPSGILSWIEAIGCNTSPLMKDHGHVIYDVYMTASYIFFYVLCWMRSTRLSSTIRKVKKAEY